MHPFSFTGADVVPLARTRAVPMAPAMSNDAIAARSRVRTGLHFTIPLLIFPSVSCLIRLGATPRGAVVGSGVGGGRGQITECGEAAAEVMAQVRRLIERFIGA
jgi:hypothetical protein